MNKTEMFIYFVIAAIVMFDLWTVLKKGSNTSISQVLFKLSSSYPVIAFGIGFAFGHIFWPNC